MYRFLSSKLQLRLFNVGIRGATVLGRFVLIMFLAKFLPHAELGKFGVFVATVLLCVLLVSVEFNKYMYRELFVHASETRKKILGSHCKVVISLYALSVPFSYSIFLFGLIPVDYIGYFYSLLFLILISLELEALLVVLGKQLLASVVFCSQTSLWVFVAIPMVYFFPVYRSLEFIYTAWAVGAATSIGVALFFLRKSDVSVDFDGMGWAWIARGLKKCVLFLISSLMLKLLLTVDRYAMNFYATAEIVGVYVFYVSVVMGVFNFLEPAVFSFIYPKMLRFYKEGNISAYRVAHKELIISTVAVVALLSLLLSYLVPFVVNVLGLNAYEHDLGSLWFVIPAGAFYMLGYIPHYVLYSRGLFKWLTYANGVALVTFAVALSLLTIRSEISRVACSLFIAFLNGALVKSYAAYVLPQRCARDA